MAYSTSHNLLIISDLHLGEDLKPASKSGLARHVPLLERELAAFLAHYRKFKRDGRPWELIINGDMVDFISVCLFPERADVPAIDDPEDHVFGLGTGPSQAATKMQRVLERHPAVFRELARFIAAGNKVGIITGNHDVEFHWPVVQETFKEGVAKLWSDLPQAARASAPTAADIAAAITFHPWFYFQENLVWVEHGHQYDTYCSFDAILNPVEPDKEKVLLSVGAAAYRYVSNHIAGLDPHQQEDWGAIGYLRFSFGLGARGLLRIARGYWGFCARMLSLWRGFVKNPAGVARRRADHSERLRELAKKVRLEEKTLVALDDLRQRPVIHNLGKVLAAIMLDRLSLTVVTAVLALGLVALLPLVTALIAVGVLVAGTWGACELLSRSRGGTDPTEKMRLVPRMIRDHVRAPFVVFGHSHHPVAEKLDGGGWYFNTGTWVATEKPGLLRAFTHLVIQHGADGPRAALCQWRDGRSLAFSPEAQASTG